MGAGASISLCQSPSSVKVLRHGARVEPEPHTPDPEPSAVFGVSLQRLREAGKLQHGVPLVLKNMVEFLEKYGLQQSGVFRVCGSAPRCRTLRVCLDRGECVDLERGDVPSVATLLKLYLRELPSALIPHTHTTHMQQALTDCKDRAELFESLKQTLSRLPDDNYNILSYLLHFLSRVAAHSQWNHMTSENLATVFGPCIFRVPEGPRMLEEQTVCNTLTLHLLEKHTHLIPDTHSRGFTLTPPQLIQEEQTHNLGAVSDLSVDETKDTNTHILITTQTLSSRDDTFIVKSDETEEEKREEERKEENREEERRGGAEEKKEEKTIPEHESSLQEMDQTCLTLSDTSSSLQLEAVEAPPPNNKNNNNPHTSHTHFQTSHTQNKPNHTHSQTNHTQNKPNHAHSATNHTHSQTNHTHSQTNHTHSQTNHTHSKTNHTHSETNHTNSQTNHTQNKPNHTHSQTSHTQNKPNHAHSKPNHTHSQTSHTLSQTNHTHSQTNYTHSKTNHTHSQTNHTQNKPNHVHSETNHAHSRTNHTHSRTRNTHSQSHTHTSNSDTHSKNTLNSKPRNTHTPDSCHTLSNSSITHSQSKPTHTHTALTHTQEELSPASSSAQSSFIKEDLRSRQCETVLQKSCSFSSVQQGVNMSQSKPSLEDTVKTLKQHLQDKRQELTLPEHVQDMSHSQLALEKITLQKCLLYYESLHGRPRSREERSVVRDLYDRYRSVKEAFYTSNTQNNTTGSENPSDVCIQQPVGDKVMVPKQEDNNPAFISHLEDLQQPTAPVNSEEIQKLLKETREEKRRLRKTLKEYKKTILLKTGRSAQKEDWGLMSAEYDHYKSLKVRLKLLQRMLGNDRG